MKEAVALPKGATVLSALELFKRTPVDLAIVVDEYGGFDGVLKRTDLLEAIAGDLPEHAGEEPEIKPLTDGGLSIDGALPLLDLQERLRITSLPQGSYHTAAGLVMTLLGRLPKLGDTVEWAGWNLEVAAMEGMTVERLVARRDQAKASEE